MRATRVATHRKLPQTAGCTLAASSIMGALARTGTPEKLEILSAEGSRVTDARGRTFIDFQMGWCVANLGWNPPEIVARVKRFKGPFYVSPKNHYAPWTELAKQLVDVAPGKLTRVYRCVGGSESVELA